MRQHPIIFFIASILLISIATPARAIPIFRAKTDAARSNLPGADGDDQVALEVSVAQAANRTEAAEAADWLEGDLEKTRARNPNARIEIVTAEDDGTGEPAVTEVQASDVKTTLRAKVNRWLTKHGRVSYSLIRGLANSGVLTWSLILAPHVAIPAALAVGIVSGAMSAGLMYFNKQYQDWLLKTKNVVGQNLRFSLTNVVYLAIAKGTAAITGIAPEHTLLEASKNVLTTSMLGTFAQGTWSLGIAISSKMKAEKAKAAGKLNDDKLAAIDVGNNVATLSVSMISTALAVAKLVGVPFTDIGLIGMGAAGSVYYSVKLMQQKKWQNRKLQKAVELKQCASNLAP